MYAVASFEYKQRRASMPEDNLDDRFPRSSPEGLDWAAANAAACSTGPPERELAGGIEGGSRGMNDMIVGKPVLPQMSGCERVWMLFAILPREAKGNAAANSDHLARYRAVGGS